MEDQREWKHGHGQTDARTDVSGGYKVSMKLSYVQEPAGSVSNTPAPLSPLPLVNEKFGHTVTDVFIFILTEGIEALKEHTWNYVIIKTRVKQSDVMIVS